jgi:hypothetical protein
LGRDIPSDLLCQTFLLLKIGAGQEFRQSALQHLDHRHRPPFSWDI